MLDKFQENNFLVSFGKLLVNFSKNFHFPHAIKYLSLVIGRGEPVVSSP